MTFLSDGSPITERFRATLDEPRFEAAPRRSRRKCARVVGYSVDASNMDSKPDRVCETSGGEQRQTDAIAEALPTPESESDRREKRPYRKIYIEADWTVGLPRRAANALRAFGIRSRQALIDLPARSLERIPNIGQTSLEDIHAWLQRATDPEGAMHRPTRT